MSVPAFAIGIAVPAIFGWLCIRLCEGRVPLLGKWERWCWGLSLGPTAMMLAVFTLHIIGLVKLNLVGFLIPISVVLALLAILSWKKGFYSLTPSPSPDGRGVPPEAGSLRAGERLLPLPPGEGRGEGCKKWLIILLLLWTALKLLAGAYDLFTVPTYWDDSFNNWNMRGKIFFVEQRITLEIPTGNDVIQTAEGVSSYPPSLSMVKTWVSTLRGRWSEPLVNGIQLLWIAGLLGSLFFALKREVGTVAASVGLYALVSLPLLLIHSTNPYAEIFVASHLFLTVYALYRIRETDVPEEVAAWLRLFGLSLGLLLFTKNEAMVIYAPILGILFLWTLWSKHRESLRLAYAACAKRADVRSIVKSVVPGIALAIVLALPWFTFKWMNGLTFGNAKAVSDTVLSFNPLVLQAIWVNLTREPNFLLLPFVLPLALIAYGRKAFQGSIGIFTWFVLLAAGMQFAIFTLVSALNTEAIMQTGLTRGLTHLAPIAVMVVLLSLPMKQAHGT